MGRARKVDPTLKGAWEEVFNNFTGKVDPSLLRLTKSAKPWDICVSINIPIEEDKKPRYSMILTDFFKKNPSAKFETVAFLQREKKDNRKKSLVTDVVAVFDTVQWKDHAASIIVNPDSGSASVRSRAHILSLFAMFGEKVPVERGQTAEIFLKCTPPVEGEGRDYLKVVNVTKMTQLKPTKGK